MYFLIQTAKCCNRLKSLTQNQIMLNQIDKFLGLWDRLSVDWQSTFLTFIQDVNCVGFFVYLLFGSSTGNFWPLLEGQPHLPGVNYCVHQVLTWRSPGTLQWGWFPKHGRLPNGIWTRHLPITFSALTH